MEPGHWGARSRLRAGRWATWAVEMPHQKTVNDWGKETEFPRCERVCPANKQQTVLYRAHGQTTELLIGSEEQLRETGNGRCETQNRRGHNACSATETKHR